MTDREKLAGGKILTEIICKLLVACSNAVKSDNHVLTHVEFGEFEREARGILSNHHIIPKDQVGKIAEGLVERDYTLNHTGNGEPFRCELRLVMTGWPLTSIDATRTQLAATTALNEILEVDDAKE